MSDPPYFSQLNEIFTNPKDPGSFLGLTALSFAAKKRGIKASKSQIKRFLLR